MPKKIIKMVFVLLIITPILSCTVRKGWQELRAGKEYAKRSDYRRAIKKYSEMIEKNPDYWKVYVYRSVAYEEINKIDLAIVDLSSGLKLIPKIDKGYGKLPRDEWALIYVKRGTLYHKTNFYNKAIDDYDKALELDPQCIGAYFYRAGTKEKINQLSAAIEDYSKTVDMMSKLLSGISNSEKSMVYLNRAIIYRKQNKFDFALADHHRAIKIDGSAKAFLSRGITLCKMENFEKAISDFDKSIKINPSDETAYIYRASTRLITNCDLKKILEDYYSVIGIRNIDDDTRQLVYNQIAWLLATAADDNIRDREKAVAYAQKAVGIKADCRSLDTLAVAFAGNGKYEDAINTHRQAIDICRSSNPELLSEVEKHLENYNLKKEFREDCPGVEIEKAQLRKWQSELYH
ncbi:MAG: tetratricopeptide repeat protein [Proteobacteria bacterium]|nr:tetratricopeptide repeat protein [Pseudomonadota bacterium]